MWCFGYLATTLLKYFYRLHDLGHLVILYPNKQKDDVFGKYYAPDLLMP